MSESAIEAVLKYSSAKGASRLVLLCIAHHADETGRAQLSLAELSNDTRIHRNHIPNHIRRLVESQELKKSVGVGRSINVYSISLPVALTSDDIVTNDFVTSDDIVANSFVTSDDIVANNIVTTTPVAVTKSSLVETPHVVNVVVNKTTWVERLAAAGVKGKNLDLIVSDPVLFSRVPAQLEYLPSRNADDPAAILVAAIKGNWSAPSSILKRQKTSAVTQERRAEREHNRAKRAEQAHASAEKIAETAKEAARLDAKYLSLTDSERAAVDAEAESALGVLARGGRAIEALNVKRRAIVKERFLG